MPDFDAAILAAEAAFIDSQIANIREAAKKNWQASAWLLERKFPEHFSQPQVQLSLPSAKPQFDDFPAMVERYREYLRRRGDSVIDVPALPVHQPAGQDEKRQEVEDEQAHL